VSRATPFEALVELIHGDYLRRGLRSWDRVESALPHLRKFFSQKGAASISYLAISSYITLRTTEGAQTGTIRAEVAYLKRMLRLAVAARLLKSAPVFPTLRASPARQVFLTEEQLFAVVSHLKQPVAELVHALWITGWRRRELQFLPWTEVDVEAGEIRLTADRSKTDEPRVFPFSASRSLAAVVQSRYSSRPVGSKYLFERSPGNPIKDFRGAWKRACKEAGIVGKVPHDLRRSRARALSRAGVPQSSAMKVLGHKTASMFLRYDVAAPDDLIRAVEAAEGSANGTLAVQSSSPDAGPTSEETA
jgi:integrase